MTHKLLHDPVFIAGACIVFFFLVICVVSPAPHDPYKTDITKSLAPPSIEYPLGRDEQGRCIFSRLICGTKITLGTALIIEIAILVIGITLGISAGFFGGCLDTIVLILIDVLLSFPSLILALVIAGVLGFGLAALIIALIAVFWVEPARIARNLCRSLREKDFILATHALGASNIRIIFKHILPNLLPQIFVYGALNMSSVIISVSSMSFLGLGVTPPTPEWGALLASNRFDNPLMIIAVIVCIIAVSVAFQMIGESARDVVSPRLSHLNDNLKMQAICTSENKTSPLLSVSNLTICFPTTKANLFTAVDNFCFEIKKGEAVGIVGDSGCGKTVVCSALLGMVETPGIIKTGSIIYENGMQILRGKDVSMLPQNYGQSLNHCRTIESQFIEAIRVHKKNLGKKECIELAENMLKTTRLDNPKQIMKQYPFELSGGMLQRIMIAMALVHNPKLLIADEPTTALDTINRSAMLKLFLQIRKQYNTSIIFISHDTEAAEIVCDRVVKM